MIGVMASSPAGGVAFFRLAILFCLLSIVTSVVAEYPFSAIDPIIKGCRSNEESSAVAQAWREAGELANAHYEWSPGGTWQNVMDLYLGNDSSQDYDFWGDPGPLVGQNIAREWSAHFAGFAQHPINTYAWIYCHEESLPRYDADKAYCQSDHVAYTWTQPGFFWTAHYVVLCPQFWEFSSLADLMSKADGDIGFQMDLDNWYTNRALTLMHESYHWPDTVSIPKCADVANMPQDVCNLAYYYNTNGARLNAESYAEAAMAIYLMKTFHHTDVPTPGGTPFQPDPIQEANATDLLSSSGPSGWTAPVNTSSRNFTWQDESGAALLSSHGAIVDADYGDCQEGHTFWNLTQCMVFCVGGTCAPPAPAPAPAPSPGPSQSWWACGGCRTAGTCAHGASFGSAAACGAGCANGTCGYARGVRAVTCRCPCAAGTYGDFDGCAAACGPGTCSQSAGQEGVRCAC